MECIIGCDPVLRNGVLGIFSKDELTTQLALEIGRASSKSPCAIIVNTDNRSGPGKHWFALFISDIAIELFDSLDGDSISYKLTEIKSLIGCILAS